MTELYVSIKHKAKELNLTSDDIVMGLTLEKNKKVTELIEYAKFQGVLLYVRDNKLKMGPLKKEISEEQSIPDKFDNIFGKGNIFEGFEDIFGKK